QAQYRQVVKINPSAFRAGGALAVRVKGMDTDDFPVESVSWNDAVRFCELLSELPQEKAAKRVYRLPSEAGWEDACRAGPAPHPTAATTPAEPPPISAASFWVKPVWGVRARWGRTRRTPGGCATCTATSRNGAPTGRMPGRQAAR